MEYAYTIINTDPIASHELRSKLADFKEFRCSGVASDCSDGLNVILKQMPDVIFVDLTVDPTSCFAMIAELHQYLKYIPLCIAISKTKDFAFDAIKNGFFDYWLQPLNEFDIRKTALKLQKQVSKEPCANTKICLKSYKDYRYIDTNDILYLKADNNTTDFFLKDGSIVSAFKTLKTFENKLPQNFIRIHQSYMLNTDYISRINYGKAICTLNNGETQLPFSKSYKNKIDDLKKLLSKSAITALN